MRCCLGKILVTTMFQLLGVCAIRRIKIEGVISLLVKAESVSFWGMTLNLGPLLCLMM